MWFSISFILTLSFGSPLVTHAMPTPSEQREDHKPASPRPFNLHTYMALGLGLEKRIMDSVFHGHPTLLNYQNFLKLTLVYEDETIGKKEWKFADLNNPLQGQFDLSPLVNCGIPDADALLKSPHPKLILGTGSYLNQSDNKSDMQIHIVPTSKFNLEHFVHMGIFPLSPWGNPPLETPQWMFDPSYAGCWKAGLIVLLTAKRRDEVESDSQNLAENLHWGLAKMKEKFYKGIENTTMQQIDTLLTHFHLEFEGEDRLPSQLAKKRHAAF